MQTPYTYFNFHPKPKKRAPHPETGKPIYGRATELPATVKPVQPPKIKPVAKKLKRVKSNLGLQADQFKIHKACYHNYLIEQGLDDLTIIRVLQCYDQFIEPKSMETIFPYPMREFHEYFTNLLLSL